MLLSCDDPPAAEFWASTTRPEVLIVCDHAGMAIPKMLGRLSLPENLILADQHIAVDIGAKQLSLKVAQNLGATRWQTFWRGSFPLSLPGIGAGALYSGMRFQGIIGRIPELYYVGGFGTTFMAMGSPGRPIWGLVGWLVGWLVLQS